LDYLQLVASGKDIVVGVAAAVGAVVAVMGLSTWKRQLKGGHEYKLSKRVLVHLFRYRDAINGVRHPAMWGHEMSQPPEEQKEGMSREQIHFYGTSKAYEARWDRVQTERTGLYADLLEAEAIWGDELKNLFHKLFDLEFELLTSIRHYLELTNPDVPECRKDAVRKIVHKRRDIMYDDFSAEGDEYKKQFNAGAAEIEGYLKPKLAR